MKIMLDAGATMPTRAHPHDAGLDLYARDSQIVPAKDSAVFDTGVQYVLLYRILLDSLRVKVVSTLSMVSQARV